MTEPQPPSFSAVAGRIHTAGLLVMVIAWAWTGAISAARIRTHAAFPLMATYVATILVEWLIVAYVVAGIRRHGGSVRELIGGSWNRLADFFRDVMVAIAFWIICIITLVIVRLVIHARTAVESIRFLAPRTGAEIAVWLLAALTAGICEEIIFRGYFQCQFIAATGKPYVGILMSAALFGALHAYQGGKQTIVLGVFGALLGVLAYRRRSLRPGMMAHAWQDALAGLLLRLLVK